MTYTGAEIVEIGQLAVTAGSLLLNEPDEDLQHNLQQSGYASSEQPIRQRFYDRLGIPQSGLYLPTYEHVFRKRSLDDGLWHFPPARHDGGAGVEAIYHAHGFHLSDIITSPLFKGANIPGDHLGFMLIFVGTALQGIGTGEYISEAFSDVISGFISEHLDGWVDSFCKLLSPEEENGYLKAISDAVQESVNMIRIWNANEMENMTTTASVINQRTSTTTS